MKLTQAKERTLRIALQRASRLGDNKSYEKIKQQLQDGDSLHLKTDLDIIEESFNKNRIKQEEYLREIEQRLENLTLEIEYKNSKEYSIHRANDTINKGVLRRCNVCLISKKPNLFGINKYTIDGLNNTCKKCKNHRERKRGRKRVDPQKQKENTQRAKERLERKYKEFFDESEGFLIGMGYKKAIGVRTKNLYVNENADFKKIACKTSKKGWLIKDVIPCISYHKYYNIGNTPVHKIMAYTFLGHTPKGHKVVVDHINNNKLDNSVKNLQLVTNFENLMKGRVQTGCNNKFEKYIKHIDY